MTIPGYDNKESIPSGDDPLLSTQHAALHPAEMGSPDGLCDGVRNSDPQALPVGNV